MDASESGGTGIPQQVVIQYDVPCELRDGSILYADIARPAGKGKWPVILTRTPYNKAQAFVAAIDVAASARLGFVGIIQDTRNRAGSTGPGDFEPWIHEEADGAEAVQWAASLPYCNGDVFMMGPSYLGFTQWAAAAQQPPALRGINPIIAPGNFRRTTLYRGGVLELECNVFWWTMMGADMLIRRNWTSSLDMQAALIDLGAKLEGLWQGGLESLPLEQFGALQGSPLGDAAFSHFREDESGPIMAAAARAQQYEHIAVPALVVGGWYDMFIQGSIDQFVGMRSRGATAKAREQTRLVVGPWGHIAVGGSVTGERAYPLSAAMTSLSPYGAPGLAAQYFADLQRGDEPSGPPVKIWVMGADTWRDEQEWPIARTKITPWYIASGGNANGANGDGVVSPDMLGGPADSFIYDPAAPVPTHGGAMLGVTTVAGSRDQRPIENREDLLVYTSPVLGEAIEVTGTAVMELWATTDVMDTDFVARLVDVHPDGKAMLVTDGVLRARYRNDPESFQSTEPLTPGEAYLFRIELLPTSYLFKQGHRLRVHITSSCFPRWARNLNIWDEWGGTLADAKVAHQQVLHDPEHVSRILLPTIPLRT